MNQPGLGEQALDKVAEVAIKSQLDEVEDISVDIRTDPLQIVQGKVDSVAISGEGLVMQQDLRVESLEVSTDAVSIDPMKAILGQIQLTQPTNAEAQIVLNQADINRALNSSYLQGKINRLDLQIQGKPSQYTIRQVKLFLLEQGQISLEVALHCPASNEEKAFSAIARPHLKDQGYRIELEIISAEGQGLSIEFMKALFDQVIELLDLRNFELSGMSLRLKTFEVQQGKLVITATTLVEQLPTGL